MIEIVTDGSYAGFPARVGSWAFVAKRGGLVIHQESGREETLTWSVRCELVAIVKALEWYLWSTQSEPAVLRTDLSRACTWVQLERPTRWPVLLPLIYRARYALAWTFGHARIVQIDARGVIDAHNLARSEIAQERARAGEFHREREGRRAAHRAVRLARKAAAS